MSGEESREPQRHMLDFFSSPLVENKGSTARDYCALERTYLSHVRLGLVMFILSVSLVLRARLPDPTTSDTDHGSSGRLDRSAVPFGSLYIAAALAAVIFGWRWYNSGLKGLVREMGFLDDPKTHDGAMVVITLLIFATAIFLLLE